jgi:hypothetical protein
MKIILILFIATMVISCNSKQKPSPIVESHVRLLRAEKDQLIQITDRNNLEMNDYVMFDQETNKNMTLEDLKKNPASPYKISSLTSCKIQDEDVLLNMSLNQSYIQLKSILPLEFFLSTQNESTCSFKITLEKDGSTKTFNFSNITIKNKNSNPTSLLGDEKAVQLKSVPTTVLESDLDKLTVVNTESKDIATMICENFYTEPVTVENRVLTLKDLARYAHVVSKTKNELDPRIYVPHQNCVIHIRKENGSADLSATFQVQYVISEPVAVFTNNPYVQADPPSYLSNAFVVDLSNPNNYVVTVGMRKSLLAISTQVLRETCPHDHCNKRVIKNENSPVVPVFSDANAVIEKEDLFLIQLQPGQSLHITFGLVVTGHGSDYVVWDMNRNLIQNLHRNYQTKEEILDEPEFIGPIHSN